MPAENEKTRKLMGAALAAKRGEAEEGYSPKAERMASEMSEDQLRDFATKKSLIERMKKFVEKSETTHITSPQPSPTQGIKVNKVRSGSNPAPWHVQTKELSGKIDNFVDKQVKDNGFVGTKVPAPKQNRMSGAITPEGGTNIPSESGLPSRGSRPEGMLVAKAIEEYLEKDTDSSVVHVKPENSRPNKLLVNCEKTIEKFDPSAPVGGANIPKSAKKLLP